MALPSQRRRSLPSSSGIRTGEESHNSSAWGSESAEEISPGLYRFTKLTPGTYILHAEAEGYAPADFEDIVISTDPTHRLDLQLESGVTCEGRMEWRGGLADIADRLEVRFSKEAIPYPDTLTGPEKNTFSCVLAPGEHKVMVFAFDPETGQSWYGVAHIAMGSSPMEVLVPLGADGTVEGTLPIVSSASLWTLPDAVESATPIATIQSDSDGRFRLIALPEGHYQLRCRGYYSIEIDVSNVSATRVNASDFAREES